MTPTTGGFAGGLRRCAVLFGFRVAMAFPSKHHAANPEISRMTAASIIGR
jgi:hypothetical protein